MEAVKTSMVPDAILAGEKELFIKYYRIIYFGKIEALKQNRVFSVDITGSEDEKARKRRELGRYSGLLRDLARHGYIPHGIKNDGNVRWLKRQLPDYVTNVSEGPESLFHFLPDDQQYQGEEKIERAYDFERAQRIAMHKLAAKGLIDKDLAADFQQKISEGLKAEERDGVCDGPDIHFAMGAGSKSIPESFENIARLSDHYYSEILKKYGE